MPGSINRRQFIRQISASAAALAFAPGIARAARRGGIELAGAPKNVIILGAGLAGMAAGYELKRAGHNVTILEARKSPGGRLRTIRDFADGQYAEAGPLSFPPSHGFTYGYATDFGLQLRPAFSFGLDTIANLHGNRFRINASGSADIPLSLSSSERQAGVYGMIGLYLDSYLRKVGNPRRGTWPPDELKDIDGLSLAQLLRDLGASQGAIDVIASSQLGILGFGLDSISAMDGVVTEALASDSIFYEIVDGNDALAQSFKKKVKKVLKKQSVVLRIDQTETNVTVTYDGPEGVQTVTGDRVICTLPFPILKDIPISPALPDDKQAAIRDLKMTPVTRTFQQFRTRPWEDARLNGYGLTDLPIQNTYSPTMTQVGRGGILTSYAGGQRALDLSAMGESDRQDFVLRQMGKVFDGLNSKYESGLSMIWHEDEWARGAFAYFEPGQMSTLLPLAQRVEGRIHFAGEHTSAWHGWMNGALESGNRAADEVNEADAAQAISIRL